jgi:hypothetical protein
VKGAWPKVIPWKNQWGFFTEYMQNFTPTSRRIWNVEKEEGVSREMLEGVADLFT